MATDRKSARRRVQLLNGFPPYSVTMIEGATIVIRLLEFYSRSHDAVVRVYDDAGNVIKTLEHAGDFKDW